ncbi:MAG: DUF2062 domain-containing protein [Gloeobacteraceae cyanobacterium ES-bin-144]|nr:DUF2062 domain-containing protein [Verrucomicrobiales bacterium]
MSAEIDTSPKPGRLKRWVIDPVITQLTQGVTPERLAWSIAIGMVAGVFPIMGTTSLLCFLIAWWLKLNQPVIHVFSTIVYPAHLALILVFIQMGQNLHGAPPIHLSIPELLSEFKNDPMQFVRIFGLAAWHGVTAWLLVAPIAILLIWFAALPVLRRMARAIQNRKEVLA